MKNYKIGQRLKRKFHDFQEVEVVGHLNDHLIIKDSSGRHFININKVDEFFTLLEPEDIKTILDTTGSNPK